MARTRTMVPVDDLTKAAREFEHQRSVQQEAERKKNRARDLLKGWLTLKNANGEYVNGRVDENGHRHFDLKEFSVRAQRSGSTSINLERAEALAREKGVYDKVFRREVIRTFQEDELFALQQKGVITEEELDSLVETSESFSLTIADPITED